MTPDLCPHILLALDEQACGAINQTRRVRYVLLSLGWARAASSIPPRGRRPLCFFFFSFTSGSALQWSNFFIKQLHKRAPLKWRASRPGVVINALARQQAIYFCQRAEGCLKTRVKFTHSSSEGINSERGSWHIRLQIDRTSKGSLFSYIFLLRSTNF